MNKQKKQQEPELIYGGWIHNHLIEYLYSHETGKASLAWIDPKGKVHSSDQIEISGRYYLPVQDDEIIYSGRVLFPSALGKREKTKKIVKQIKEYLKKAFIFSDPMQIKVIAYYILLTWVYDSFQAIPYLRFSGIRGSGKTKLVNLVSSICYRSISANRLDISSTLINIVDKYQGTVCLDEIDLTDDETNTDLIKLLNLGAMRDGMITRMEKRSNKKGKQWFEPEMYRVFCPKLITTTKKLNDLALASRCITLKLEPIRPDTAIKENFQLAAEIEIESRKLRNILLRWRLEHWRPEVKIKANFIDYEISSRLNQLIAPLMTVAKGDPEFIESVKKEFCHDDH